MIPLASQLTTTHAQSDDITNGSRQTDLTLSETKSIFLILWSKGFLKHVTLKSLTLFEFAARNLEKDLTGVKTTVVNRRDRLKRFPQVANQPIDPKSGENPKAIKGEAKPSITNRDQGQHFL